MYLEECDPTLEAAIISAVEATADGRSAAHSPRLVEKLVEQAIDQCRALDDGTRHRTRRRCSAMSPRSAASPRSPRCSSRSARRTCATACRRCSSSRAAPKRRARTASKSRPGNTKVPRGADQSVNAQLVGFTVARRQRDDAQRAERARSSACRSSPARDPGTFEGMLFHLEKATEYYVESNGVQSPTFTLAVRRPADGAAARARVPLPRLHRPARRARSRRRRRRRDPRHRSRPARRADDDDAGRTDSC